MVPEKAISDERIVTGNLDFEDIVREHTNIQINPPRSRSHSPTCVSEIQVNSKKHVGHKKESLHNKRKVTFKQDGPHVYPDRPDIMVNRIT